MSDKTIIHIDNRTFTIERVDGKVHLSLQVHEQPSILTVLTDGQVYELASALAQNKRCANRWRAGVVRRPDDNIPHGARCIRDRHPGDEDHQFVTENGVTVTRGAEYRLSPRRHAAQPESGAHAQIDGYARSQTIQNVLPEAERLAEETLRALCKSTNFGDQWNIDTIKAAMHDRAALKKLAVERARQSLPLPLKPLTDENICINFAQGPDHDACPVLLAYGDNQLAVCKCECRPCKRAWFAAGQPITRDGQVVE